MNKNNADFREAVSLLGIDSQRKNQLLDLCPNDEYVSMLRQANDWPELGEALKEKYPDSWIRYTADLMEISNQEIQEKLNNE